MSMPVTSSQTLSELPRSWFPAERENASAPTFLLAGPSRTLVAEDSAAVIVRPMTDRNALIDEAERCLRERARESAGLLMGAIPFSEKARSHLFIPTRFRQTSRWWLPAGPRQTDSASHQLRTSAAYTAEREQFLTSVRAATAAIARGELSKVVLCRSTEFAVARRPCWRALLRTLRSQNPDGFVFALSLPDDEVDRPLLVGASPELLVSRRGRSIVSAPLAGSTARSPDVVEDRRRAQALLHSSKDRSEHRIVVEQILDHLAPHVVDLQFEREPSVTGTSTLWHLSTRIEGTLKNLDSSALRLALSIFPTPAVCGMPTAEARRWIERSEPFDRGYFTGSIGYMTASGDGDWIVTIRCAELHHDKVRVFAGAGIVAGSEEEAELAETDAKMRTMFEALAAAGAV